MVDVILGPLITLTVFNRSKPRSELVRDLTVVGLIQLAALGYGLWTVFVARPVHLVFEYDRFRVCMPSSARGTPGPGAGRCAEDATDRAHNSGAAALSRRE